MSLPAGQDAGANDSDTDADTDSDTDVDTDVDADTDTDSDIYDDCWSPAERWYSDHVAGISYPTGTQVVVELASEGTYSFDTSAGPITEVWLSTLQTCLDYDWPVSLMVDVSDAAVLDVTHPLVGYVMELTEVDGGVQVMIAVSAAIHFLSEEQPCYQMFRDSLAQSLIDQSDVVVTETDLDGMVFVLPAEEISTSP